MVVPLFFAVPLPAGFVVLGVRQEMLDEQRPLHPLVGVTHAADQPVFVSTDVER